MDAYPLLRLAHVAGFILLGGGLLAVFVSEWRAYRTRDPGVFAEAARYTALFYDALALPGAVLIGISGWLLVRDLGLGWFEAPWLAGMWGLFLFEFIEGNTITRLQFRRTLRLSRTLAAEAALREDDRRRARTWFGQVAHFLDLPLFSAIVYCGVVRPEQWSSVGLAIGTALAAAAGLTVAVPCLSRPQISGREDGSA